MLFYPFHYEGTGPIFPSFTFAPPWKEWFGSLLLFVKSEYLAEEFREKVVVLGLKIDVVVGFIFSVLLEEMVGGGKSRLPESGIGKTSRIGH